MATGRRLAKDAFVKALHLRRTMGISMEARTIPMASATLSRSAIGPKDRIWLDCSAASCIPSSIRKTG
jgi:hypothetical protein